MTTSPKRPAVGRFGTVVIDCPDPRALAEFHAGLLGQEVADDGDDYWQSLKGDGSGVSLAFSAPPPTSPPVGRTGRHSSCIST